MSNPFFKNFGPFKIDMLLKKVSVSNPENFKTDKNLILITHYVLISEVLGYAPSSGEIVVSDLNLNIIGNIKIDF